MLPKKRRLTSVEVRGVLAQGRSSRGVLFSVKHIPGTTPLRASVVVSKKVAKRAVDRNRLRRAAYDALASLEVRTNGRAVFFVQKIPSEPLRPAFVADLVVLLKKII